MKDKIRKQPHNVNWLSLAFDHISRIAEAHAERVRASTGRAVPETPKWQGPATYNWWGDS